MRQFIFVFILFLSASMFSQNSSSINGQLVDGEFNNEPLAFGTISIKGTVNETTANLDGNYSFENLSPGEYVLVYSFVGYETKERIVKVDSKKNTIVNVTMEAQRPTLNKLVTSKTSSSKAMEETETSSIHTKA